MIWRVADSCDVFFGEKNKKRCVKLELSGRIAAFLGGLDTQEKANSPSSPRADRDELSEDTALWPHQKTEL